jgi:predicted SnoaL-like aldol condensation-catalyzing enzyme
MPHTPQEQRNLDHVRGLFYNVLLPLDYSKVDQYIAPGSIQHSQMAEPGRDALKAFLDYIKGVNSNSTQSLKRIFVDDDHVIMHTHVIRWPDDPGLAVIDIFRLEDGMVVEHWDCVQEVPTDSPNPNSMF